MASVTIDENLVAQLVTRGVVTDTFRRLPPDKKSRLYRTAIKLFGEFGYDGLAIDQLCGEAGISKGSFFQYFPSKTHLLEFVILIFDDYLGKWVTDIRAADTGALARQRPTLVFAVIGQARAAGRLTPERESALLSTLLEAWAVRTRLLIDEQTTPPSDQPLIRAS